MMTTLNSSYIRHLSSFAEVVQKDKRLTTNHVNLYLVLFNIWNQYPSRQPFQIVREKVLKMCSMSCLSTYYNCLKDLHTFGYIHFYNQPRAYGGLCFVNIVPLSAIKENMVSASSESSNVIQLYPPGNELMKQYHTNPKPRHWVKHDPGFDDFRPHLILMQQDLSNWWNSTIKVIERLLGLIF